MATASATVSRLPGLTFTLCVGAAAFLVFAGEASAQGRRARLSSDLAERVRNGDVRGASVIITGTEARVNGLAARHGLRIKERLATGAVVEVPAGALTALANDPQADAISSNHAVAAQMALTNQAIGADVVHDGGWAAGIGPLTGKGIGVAVIDSGVAPVPELRGRIVASVDFTDERGPGLDKNGHGTHVAGIIAAAGRNKSDDITGVAPGANIISLRVLDAKGRGVVGDVVQAIDYAVANKARYNIRVINLSLGGPVTQGWRDDPLCQAVERAYRAGITVVAAAGNFGKTEDGLAIYGGITTPGISPFAITVGAVKTNGTAWRSDDEIAGYSSKGPTLFDRLVKPDLVAPGNKILGLAAPGSTLVREHPELVVAMAGGRRLLLSGTSMAAGVVSGAVSVLLEGRVRGTESIRRVLQHSSNKLSTSYLVSGAGALNLDLAAAYVFAPSAMAAITSQASLTPSKTAFCTSATCFVAAHANDGIVWSERDGIVWSERDGIVWSERDGIVWSERDGIVWSERDGIVWSEGDGIVWSEDGIVWSEDGIVWSEGDGIVWSEGDGIVWSEGDGIVWSERDGIVWSERDGIVWSEGDGIVWSE